MAKQLLFDKDAKDALKKGVDKVANAVGSTMGAAGKTVIISHHYNLNPIVTKDGITVASSVIVDDEIENIGVMMVKQASGKTALDAGDGTTQTAVLTQSMIGSGLKAINQEEELVSTWQWLVNAWKNKPEYEHKKLKPQEVKKGIEMAVNGIVEFIQRKAYRINGDNNKLRDIATISANNDAEIGGLIADAYAKIGHDGLLMIEESGTINTTIEVVKGVEIPKGYTTPFFVNEPKKMEVVHDNVLWLVTDYSLAKMDVLGHVLNKIHAAGLFSTHALVIVAKDFEGEVHSSMMMNHKNGVLKTCLIQAPSSYRNETLEDIATVTGATVIRDEAGLKVEGIELHHLGRSKKVIVSEKLTTIIEGEGNPTAIESLKEAVRVQMEQMDNPELKEVWKLRLARISSSMGVIRVGGSTDVEVKEKKDRVDDACRAVKSAIEEGYIVGGGVALLRAMEYYKVSKDLNPFLTDSVKAGIDIVLEACQEPLRRMLINGDLNEDIVTRVAREKRFNVGYNIKTEKFEDLVEAGVIDPVKVIRCALQNASSVAGAVITSDCLVVEIAKK